MIADFPLRDPVPAYAPDTTALTVLGPLDENPHSALVDPLTDEPIPLVAVSRAGVSCPGVAA